MYSKKIFYLLILIALTTVNAFASPPSSLKALKEEIKKSGFNGLVLVLKKNKVLFKEAFGFKNMETKVPLTTSDTFQIGSNTKQFIAAALLRLQEEGRIKLDDYATKYLPQYPTLNDVKIRDLLNHTSGVRNYTEDSGFMSTRRPNKILTLDEIIEHCLEQPFDFSPRTKFHYSNGGYILAGKIIEVVAGMSWDKYLKITFLGPLGMNKTGHQNYFEKVSDVVGHQSVNGKYKLVRGLNLSWALSAGSLHSTLDDIAKWVTIHENTSFLSEKSKKEMQTVFKENYGLGLNIQAYGQDTLLASIGMTRGFCSRIFFLKKSKIKIITFDNIDGSVKGTPELLLQYFYQNRIL